ncbi:MAG: tetratricopeptide repeat protein [Promethearchaeota archaeon]
MTSIKNNFPDNYNELIISFLNESDSNKLFKNFTSDELRSYLSFFVEEYYKYKSLLKKPEKMEFDSEFINYFFSELILIKFPHLKEKYLKILTNVVKKFINYITIKKALKRKEQKKVMENLNGNSEYNDDKINVNKISLKNMIRTDFLEFLNYILEHQNGNIEDDKISFFIDKINKHPEKDIIDVLFELFKTIEDHKSFITIIFILTQFFRFNTLPSRILDYIRKGGYDKRMLYRLLYTYFYLYYDGYLLEVTFTELIDEIKENLYVSFDMDDFQNYILSSSEEFLNGNFNDLFKEYSGEYLIDSIIPLNFDTPYLEIKNTKYFELFKDVKFNFSLILENLKKLIEALENNLNKLSGNILPQNIYVFNSMEIINLSEVKKYLFLGNYEKALSEINKFLKNYPNNPHALLLKSKIYSQLCQFDESFNCILEIIKKYPGDLKAYIELTQLLQVGGYFYSSYILSNLLLHFFPFDFNLYITAAFSAYQILKPFREYLKVGLLLDEIRLTNFLTNFWIDGRLKAKDEMNRNGINKRILTYAENIGKEKLPKVAEFLRYYNDLNVKPIFYKEFKFILDDLLYFFPDSNAHIKKNYLICEFLKEIALNCYNLIENIDPYSSKFLLNRNFIEFIFNMAKEYVELLIEDIKNKNPSLLSRSINASIPEKLINMIKNEPYYLFLRIFLSDENIENLLINVYFSITSECEECQQMCFFYPLEEIDFFKEQEDKTDIDEEYAFSFISDIIFDFDNYLFEKNLSNKTIESKLDDCWYFMEFLCEKFKDLFDMESLEDIIDENTIKIFLERYIIKLNIISSKTAFIRMKRSIKSFLSFLNEYYFLFSDEKFRKLKKIISEINIFQD